MSRSRSVITTMAIALCTVIVSLLAACGSSSSQPATKAQHQHIFVIMMENHGTDQIIGNTADAPYINKLASEYGVATNYFGVTHPSLPNYLAAISGDTQGIFDDCKPNITCDATNDEFVAGPPYNGQLLTAAQLSTATASNHLATSTNLIDQLEAKKLTWKAYMQSMPTAGYTGEYAPIVTDATGAQKPYKLYAVKHNPFMYFSDIANNPARLSNIVPFYPFADDLRQGNVPDFVWISPDQCHDMHGVAPASATYLGIPACATPASGLDHSSITLGDTFLSQVVPLIMNSPAWTKDSVIVIPWDENDYSGYAGCCKSPVGANNTVLGGDRAPLLVITGAGQKHVQDDTQYNHYSLLAQIEAEWKLDCLQNACGQASMNKLFHP